MAPKKRSTDEANAPPMPTRRSSRLAADPKPNNNNNNINEPEQPKKKKPKKSPKEKQPPAPEEVVDGGGGAGKTIIIEHCKQCTQFKIRAIKVKEGLEKGVEGVNVVVNPEKPRRGCFEIREEIGETFISLLDMKRPFGPMKALDMDQVIADIIEKIK